MFTDALVHSIDVYTCTDVNAGGRIERTWTKQATLPCRFSSPVSSMVSPVSGASVEQIDATVFTGPELLDAISGKDLPVRFITTDAGWSGTYEMRKRPRMICAGSSAIHHCECNVTEEQVSA